jgi:hypothetical protein
MNLKDDAESDVKERSPLLPSRRNSSSRERKAPDAVHDFQPRVGASSESNRPEIISSTVGESVPAAPGKSFALPVAPWTSKNNSVEPSAHGLENSKSMIPLANSSSSSSRRLPDRQHDPLDSSGNAVTTLLQKTSDDENQGNRTRPQRNNKTRMVSFSAAFFGMSVLEESGNLIFQCAPRSWAKSACDWCRANNAAIRWTSWGVATASALLHCLLVGMMHIPGWFPSRQHDSQDRDAPWIFATNIASTILLLLRALILITVILVGANVSILCHVFRGSQTWLLLVQGVLYSISMIVFFQIAHGQLNTVTVVPLIAIGMPRDWTPAEVFASLLPLICVTELILSDGIIRPHHKAVAFNSVSTTAMFLMVFIAAVVHWDHSVFSRGDFTVEIVQFSDDRILDLSPRALIIGSAFTVSVFCIKIVWVLLEWNSDWRGLTVIRVPYEIVKLELDPQSQTAKPITLSRAWVHSSKRKGTFQRWLARLLAGKRGKISGKHQGTSTTDVEGGLALSTPEREAASLLAIQKHQSFVSPNENAIESDRSPAAHRAMVATSSLKHRDIRGANPPLNAWDAPQDKERPRSTRPDSNQVHHPEDVNKEDSKQVHHPEDINAEDLASARKFLAPESESFQRGGKMKCQTVRCMQLVPLNLGFSLYERSDDRIIFYITSKQHARSLLRFAKRYSRVLAACTTVFALCSASLNIAFIAGASFYGHSYLTVALGVSALISASFSMLVAIRMAVLLKIFTHFQFWFLMGATLVEVVSFWHSVPYASADPVSKFCVTMLGMLSTLDFALGDANAVSKSIKATVVTVVAGTHLLTIIMILFRQGLWRDADAEAVRSTLGWLGAYW